MFPLFIILLKGKKIRKNIYNGVYSFKIAAYFNIKNITKYKMYKYRYMYIS